MYFLFLLEMAIITQLCLVNCVCKVNPCSKKIQEGSCLINQLQNK